LALAATVLSGYSCLLLVNLRSPPISIVIFLCLYETTLPPRQRGGVGGGVQRLWESQLINRT
ncbi:hypothetical protein, partial [Nostoc spongiaeforme]|uniref:hypothetical protein n=1 Tax=Nostoc spongiaeforme TaxID=502487 RepID=UPI001A7F0F07